MTIAAIRAIAAPIMAKKTISRSPNTDGGGSVSISCVDNNSDRAPPKQTHSPDGGSVVSHGDAIGVISLAPAIASPISSCGASASSLCSYA
jgi:hypothetical protein